MAMFCIAISTGWPLDAITLGAAIRRGAAFVPDSSINIDNSRFPSARKTGLMMQTLPSPKSLRLGVWFVSLTTPSSFTGRRESFTGGRTISGCGSEDLEQPLRSTLDAIANKANEYFIRIVAFSSRWWDGQDSIEPMHCIRCSRVNNILPTVMIRERDDRHPVAPVSSRFNCQRAARFT